MVLLVPRGGDDHALHVRLLEPDVTGKILAVTEVLEAAFDCPETIAGIETHLQPLVLISGGSGRGVRRKADPAHGEGLEHGFRMLPRLFSEGQKGGRLQPDVAVIGDCEGTCERVAEYQVVVPFLDSPLGSPDHGPVVFLNHPARPTGLAEISI